jgi:hypothetical protein
VSEDSSSEVAVTVGKLKDAHPELFCLTDIPWMTWAKHIHTSVKEEHSTLIKLDPPLQFETFSFSFSSSLL